MHTTILSCSLSQDSNSRRLAEELRRIWSDDQVTCEFLDLREFDLPLCNGGSAYEHPDTKKLSARLAETDAAVFAVPIYNFNISAAAKNLIELAGRQLENKVAGFLCAAGGHMSYMSVMAVANSLMLDFRTVILPRFVFAAGDDFADPQSLSDVVQSRIETFGAEFQTLARAVTNAG